MNTRTMGLVLVALLLLPGAMLAEDQQAYTWVSFLKQKQGEGDALTKLLIEQDSAIFDALVDSGEALEWGIALPVIHDGKDPYSHAEWITFSSWAGVDSFMGRFMERQMSMSEEERKAMTESYEAAVMPGSHADAIHRVAHSGSGEPGRPGYIMFSTYKAKFGKGPDASKLWKELAQPVYEQLATDGQILSYGLFVPEIHRGQGWTHASWYTTTSLAARDVVSKAFDEAEAARSEEENAAIMSRFVENFEPDAHTDQILLVVHHKAGGGDS